MDLEALYKEKDLSGNEKVLQEESEPSEDF